jgi:hypothetical protein
MLLAEAGNPAARIITSDRGLDVLRLSFQDYLVFETDSLRMELFGIAIENLDISPGAVVTIQAADGSRITLRNAK